MCVNSKDRQSIAKKISNLCPSYWEKNYTYHKIKSDPLYEGVYVHLKNSKLPLLDIGCGIGILSIYLRNRNWSHPIVAFDYDRRKVKEGSELIKKSGFKQILIKQGDARIDLPSHDGNVTVLDILQFFEPHEQENLMKLISSKVPKNGKLIIRSCLRKRNLRFLITWLVDIFAKLTFWMKAAPTHYPTEDFFQQFLENAGFSVEVKPLWGNTPFNNYLIVAQRFEKDS